MHRWIIAIALLSFALPLQAQSLRDRIADYKRKQSTRQRDLDQEERQQEATLKRRLYDIMADVDLDNIGAKSAITWWSDANNIPIVVNWSRMETEGITDDTPISVKLRNVPTVTVLEIILQQMAPIDASMIYEVTPWYVQIMTREEAISKTVLRVYDLGDMIMEVPNFSNAPSLDLNAAVSGTGSRGGNSNGTSTGGGSSGGSLFGNRDDDDDDDDDDDRLTKADRAEQIADIIRNTIEPDIWQANGGQYSSVQYFSNRLVIRAPLFVHRQIGPSMGLGAGYGGGRRAAVSSGGGVIRASVRRERVPAPSTFSNPSDVSGVQRTAPTSPSGVQPR